MAKHVRATASVSNPYHVIDYSGFDRATIICVSECGPIQVSTDLGQGSRSVFFRPDSPLYNVQNTTCAGHVIIHLRNTADPKDVAAITFINNTNAQGDVSVKVAVNDPTTANQERLDFLKTLQPRESITVHIVFNL